MCALVQLWGSESVLSFYLAGLENQTQVIKFSNKHPVLLSCVSDPSNLINLGIFSLFILISFRGLEYQSQYWYSGLRIGSLWQERI